MNPAAGVEPVGILSNRKGIVKLANWRSSDSLGAPTGLNDFEDHCHGTIHARQPFRLDCARPEGGFFNPPRL